MDASVRPYAGNADLADTLAEHEDEIREVRLASSRTRQARRNRIAPAAAWLAENLPDLGVGAPQVTAGEVRIRM